MFAVTAATITLCLLAAAAEPAAETWRAVELSFTSAQARAHPFDDVDLTATFTGPTGESIVRPGFWDGGQTWRVRFAAPTPGTWTWSTVSNEPSLHDRHGQLACRPYAGDLPIYQHGFLRISDDRRHLAYRDGTPFFWLADTHWLWEKERLAESNRPDWPSQFKGMVDRRVEQGFSVYQVELFGRWRRGGQLEPDVEHFQTNVDPKWQYLAEHGLVVATTLGILNKNATHQQGEREARMARYVCARYGAYPAVWLMYQECTGNRHEQFADEAARQEYLDVVRAVGRAYQAADAYHQPRTAHSDASVVTAFRGEDWLDLTMFQGGHGPVIDRDRYYGFYFDRELTLPQLEGEADYEHLFDGSQANQKRLVTTDAMREKAWQAMQCGCCGYTYGGNGVWQATWGGEQTGNQTVYGNTPWYEGIDLPGAVQLGHLETFYRALPWTELLPRPACDGFLTGDEERPVAQRPAVAATPRSDTVVVYFYRGEPFAPTLHHLLPTTYTARWFDPRTGRYTDLPRPQVSADGSWTCPPQPNDQDWVLLLVADQPAPAEAPTAPFHWPEIQAQREAEEARNVAKRAHASASSTDLANKVYDPRCAIDGNLDTSDWRHWSNDAAADPASPDHPVWLRLDWDQPVSIGRVRFYTMQGYEAQDYALEWLDGDTWRVLPGTEVTGNTETEREHVADRPVTTRALRFLGRRGSRRQRDLVRVVELQVFGD